MHHPQPFQSLFPPEYVRRTYTKTPKNTHGRQTRSSEWGNLKVARNIFLRAILILQKALVLFGETFRVLCQKEVCVLGRITKKTWPIVVVRFSGQFVISRFFECDVENAVGGDGVVL